MFVALHFFYAQVKLKVTTPDWSVSQQHSVDMRRDHTVQFVFEHTRIIIIIFDFLAQRLSCLQAITNLLVIVVSN